MQRLLPPILWLLLLIVVAVIMGLRDTLHRTDIAELDLRMAPFADYRWAGAILGVTGLALLIAGRRAFSIADTNINTFDKPTRLVTNGVFAVSRNPMYLGFLLTLLGVSVLTFEPLTLIAPAIFWAASSAWYIPFEERAAATAFGDAYQDYCRRTRRWI